MGDALPFTFELEDISGNSHIENPHAPSADPTMVVTAFDRNHDMNVKVRFNSVTDLRSRVSNEEPSITSLSLTFTVHCSFIPYLLFIIHCSRAHVLTCYLLTVHSCSSQLSLEHNDEMMPDDVRAIKVAQAAQAKAVADRKADMEAKMAATLANPVTAEEKEQVREIITFNIHIPYFQYF